MGNQGLSTVNDLEIVYSGSRTRLTPAWTADADTELAIHRESEARQRDKGKLQPNQ